MLGLARYVTHGSSGGGNPTLNYNFVDGSAFPSAITFTRASTATFFNSSGVLTSAGNDVPRLDYDPSTLAAQGLLIEEQRTNSIRNNTMQGAVAGTPGTAPTNWTLNTPTGLTRTIVGTGTENGINYVDVRYQGTAGDSTAVALSFESNTEIIASNGQNWSLSSFLKIVSGSTNGVDLKLTIAERTSVGAGILNNNSSSLSVISTLTRFTFSATLNGGVTVARVRPDITFTQTNGAAIDITLRIGLPQLEQGSFATSVIPTTTTALTRSADVASVNTLSSWYNATSGTLFSEYVNVTTATGSLFSIDDGTTNNRIIEFTSGGTNAAVRVVTGGVDQVSTNVGAVTANTIGKLAFAYATNDFSASVNGAAVVTDTSGTVPSGLTTARLGINVISAAALNGYLRRITYYPVRLTNAALQQITT